MEITCDEGGLSPASDWLMRLEEAKPVPEDPHSEDLLDHVGVPDLHNVILDLKQTSYTVCQKYCPSLHPGSIITNILHCSPMR